MKVLSDSLSKWVKEDLISLGTDGYGRSDDRPALRNHFEVDANAIIWSVLASLNLKGQYKDKDLEKAREELGIDINKPNPLENKMAIEFKLPELGENIEGGDIVNILVSEGDSVDEGQSIVEIEAGKASMEIPSPIARKKLKNYWFLKVIL